MARIARRYKLIKLSEAKKNMQDSLKRSQLGRLADEIEAELRVAGWNPDPPTEETVLAGGAFGLGTVAFETWLQVVFISRLRQVAAGEIDIPASSSVAAQASREWDGVPGRERLFDLISEVDRIVES
jgi:uncharacterized protein YqcC (DUF446 family)